MNTSNVYQLIGAAYLAGQQAGMQKQAGVIGALVSQMSKGVPGTSRLEGFGKGLGIGVGSAGGALAGNLIGTFLANNHLRMSDYADIIPHISSLLGAGLGGYLGYSHLAPAMLKAHNKSLENDLNSSKKSKEEDDDKIEKKASDVGAIIGAVHPEMSALGGAARGTGIALGGKLGLLLGGGLGAAAGYGLGQVLGVNPVHAGLVGGLIGGVPGAAFGGYKGHSWAKKMLQEHADLPDNHRAKRKKDKDEDED